MHKYITILHVMHFKSHVILQMLQQVYNTPIYPNSHWILSLKKQHIKNHQNIPYYWDRHELYK